MAFKGTLPSDLWLKYSVEGGRRLMELDLLIAADINDKISEATNKASKTDAKGMVARGRNRLVVGRNVNERNRYCLRDGWRTRGLNVRCHKGRFL